MIYYFYASRDGLFFFHHNSINIDPNTRIPARFSIILFIWSLCYDNRQLSTCVHYVYIHIRLIVLSQEGKRETERDGKAQRCGVEQQGGK